MEAHRAVAHTSGDVQQPSVSSGVKLKKPSKSISNEKANARSRSTTPPPLSVGTKAGRSAGLQQQKKRKKSTKTLSPNKPRHASVEQADVWTRAGEQVEEIRAACSLYSSPTDCFAAVPAKAFLPSITTTTETPACYASTLDMTTAATTTCAAGNASSSSSSSRSGSIVDVGPEAVESSSQAGTQLLAKKHRVNRPWEWSAIDCSAVLTKTIGRSTQPGHQQQPLRAPAIAPPSLVSAESESDSGWRCSAIRENPDSTCAAHGAPVNANSGGDRSSKKDTGGGVVNVARPKRPSNLLRLVGADCSMPLYGQPLKDGYDKRSPPLGRKRACASSVLNRTRGVVTPEVPKEQEDTSCSPRKTVAPSAPPCSKVPPGGSSGVRGQRRVDANSSTSSAHRVMRAAHMRSGANGATITQDEQTARELSAVLNRNYPRRRQGREGADNINEPKLKREDEPSIGRSALRARKGDVDAEATDAKTPSAATVQHNSSGEHSQAKVNMNTTTASREVASSISPQLDTGANVEVWWEDAWYRCTVASLTASEGELMGVLEFLPYRAKSRKRTREYSTKLNLSNWVHAGHLTRPGTNLQWGL